MHRALTLTAALFLAANTFANEEFKAEMSTLCEKTKSCAIDEIKKSLPENMHEMAVGMVSQACASIEQSYAYLEQSEYADLIDSATACMKSMSSKDCAELMNNPETQECKDYEKEAAKYEQK